MTNLSRSLPLLALSVAACGGAGPSAAPTPAAPAGPASAQARPSPGAFPDRTSPPASRPTGDLQAQLQAAIRGPQPGDAIVTYAVFAPGAPEKRADQRLALAVDAAFRTPAPELVEPARRTGPLAASLTVTAAPVDAELPLDLAVIVQQAGPLAGAVAHAGQVVFVRYAGRPLPGATQITGAGLAAVAVARALGAPAIVDLSTFEAAAPDAFAASLVPVPDLKSHVCIVPEARVEAVVTLRTRGLARFGKPDLEMDGVAPADLQAAGARYMEVVRAVWEAPAVAVGATLAGARLAPCAAPAEAWDHECVAVPWSGRP